MILVVYGIRMVCMYGGKVGRMMIKKRGMNGYGGGMGGMLMFGLLGLVGVFGEGLGE